ncbi:MAG: hypothetical protein F4X17_07220 [Gemmatimonadetes bacterium]|nr:hypothetical protein [Gemmatimonadota bacterium]
MIVVFATLVFVFTPAYGLSSTLILDPIPARVYAGDTVVFTGTLTGSGQGLPGRTVAICEDDPLLPDECLAWVVTDGDGRYYTEWVAEAGVFETDFDIYARFNGDEGLYGDINRFYANTQTPRHTMSVYKYGGSIHLDPIPDRAAYGDVISLSGTLSLDAHSPEGSVVYIKDEDTANPDDLLVSAYVDEFGRFSTYWIVADVDPDYTIDIQAVYEGNWLYYRMTTPIQELYGYEDVTSPAPGPVPDDVYMELYRSLDFDRPPLVAIVPSPDSYNDVRGHIVPVQEGILQLTAILEHEYPAGDWSVDFEVVRPGDILSGRPDVMMDLVARDYSDGFQSCDDAWGWAFHTAPKPVPTIVCSLDGRTNAEIGATAVHEFVHAIGLGHTFNMPGDMLCSVEDGKQTCPGGTGPESTIPSYLNLAALVTIYGTDGFQNPNDNIIFKTKYATDGSITLPSVDGTNGINTANQSGQYDDVYWPEDCDFYDDVSSCLDYYCASYWDIDGFLSYGSCLMDPFAYEVESYLDVYWPDACFAYDDIYSCLDYYCASYWDIDGFLSYDSCLEDPFSYYNPYIDVYLPEDCHLYEDVDICLYYYCSAYWDVNGFLSYNACLLDPFAYG